MDSGYGSDEEIAHNVNEEFNYNLIADCTIESLCTIIGDAYRRGNSENIINLTKAVIEKRSKQDSHFPLLFAVYNGFADVVKLLIEYKEFHYDVNMLLENDEIPMIFIAAYSGHRSIVKYLIDNKVDINAVNKHGATPLYGACKKGRLEVVKLLLSCSDLNLYNKESEYNTCYYIGDSKTDEIAELIKEEAIKRNIYDFETKEIQFESNLIR